MPLGHLARIVFGLLCWVAVAQSSGTPVRDEEVTEAIHVDLWADPIVDPNGIDVTTREGIVTLSGTVATLLVRDRAEAIAESIVGVRAVVNLIEVALAQRDDASISQAVRGALLRDPATDSYELRVAVSAGTVTLSGVVDSWGERELSEAVTKDVRGVREVRNEIKIRQAVRTDAEIRAEVEARLANDVRIDDYAIRVNVDRGTVSLSGTVGSLAEKRRARIAAWVAGVHDVDDAGLETKWWARDEMRRWSHEGHSDAQIEQAVRDAFRYDPRVSRHLRVRVTGGIVTLSGVVDNAASRRSAEADARNVLGVRQVRNHLKVRPEAIPDDEELEKHVIAALADDDYVERWDVDVEARSGTVYLEGTVKSSFEKERAELRATRVKGVVRVVNDLLYQHEWRWKPDWEILSNVEDQLRWSPFVDAEAVKVSVDDGVVTLRGKVDTWAERADAARNAWEAGAKDVRNELIVVHQIYGPIARWLPFQAVL